jgi:hypothetical protein
MPSADHRTVKSRGPQADEPHVTASRVLSLLAAACAPIYLATAIAGWASGLLPATPLTFGVSALLIAGGPLLGFAHAALAREYDEEEDSVEFITAVLARPVAPPPRPIVSERHEAARAFHNWRDAAPSTASKR